MYTSGMALENYETAQETAERLGVSRSRVLRYLRDGRMPGAVKLGEGHRGQWLVPKDSRPVPASMGPAPKWAKG
jgi:excisionase family DNA binding protein